MTVRRAEQGEVRLRRRLRCRPTGRRAGVVLGALVPAVRRGRAVPAPTRPRPPQPSLHLTRRGRLVVVAIVLAVLTVAFSVGRVTSTALGNPNAPGARVVVQQGDTLWSISERIRPDADPRSTAADLMAVNGLATPSLEVGQQLRLP